VTLLSFDNVDLGGYPWDPCDSAGRIGNAPEWIASPLLEMLETPPVNGSSGGRTLCILDSSTGVTGVKLEEDPVAAPLERFEDRDDKLDD
jgi:hypothetical protein